MSELSTEQTVIACMMLDASCIDVVAATVEADDFDGATKLGAVFTAIVSLHGGGVRPDPISVRDEALRAGVHIDLDKLAELSGSLPTAVSAEYYARKVRAEALRRRLKVSSETLGALAQDQSLTDNEIIEQAMRCVETATEKATAQSVPREFWENAADHPARMQEREGGGRWYVTSGSRTIDNLTGGWQRGQLIVVAARMGVGKSAIACNFALSAARQVGDPRRVVIHSLEMPEGQVTDRLIAIDGHLNLLRLTKGELSTREREGYAKTIDRIWERRPRIVVDDRLPATLQLIKARTRQHMKRGPVDLVIVDYLQRMTGQKGEKWERVGEDVLGLKTMARELDIPVIALAQVNREGGDDAGPTLNHLAGSDEIGREADVVILLHVPKEEAEKLKQPNPPIAVEVDCILAKVRQGQMGRVKLINIPSSVTFAEPEREERAA